MLSNQKAVFGFAVAFIALIGLYFLWPVQPTPTTYMAGSSGGSGSTDQTSNHAHIIAPTVGEAVASTQQCPPCPDCPASAPAAPRIIKPVPTFRTRMELPQLLQNENFKIGVELGVQACDYAEHMLQTWTAATKYVLVDLWRHQANYHDAANVEDNQHNALFQKCQARMAPFEAKRGPGLVEVCRDYTSKCVANYPDEYFDFVYVDARHDRKGVMEDIKNWWPKLKTGGIMAGHDYVTNDETHGQDWTLNYDGTRDETGRVVKGAVDDFFSQEVIRQVQVSYRESGWNTWAVRK